MISSKQRLASAAPRKTQESVGVKTPASKVAAIMLLAVAAVTLGCSILVVKLFAAPHSYAPVPVINLAGDWTTCQPQPSMAATAHCESSKITHLPSNTIEQRGLLWQRLSRSFLTPSVLSEESLSLVFGDVGMLVAVRINGVDIGEGGLFPSAHHPNRLYPVIFKLPHGLLHRGGQPNDIQLKLFSISPAQSGPYKGPIGLFRSNEAQAFVRSQTLGTIFMPLSCAVALTLVAAAVALYSVVYESRVRTLWWFGIYCLSHIIFLLSFVDINYEIVPMTWAIFLRYLTGGRLADVSLFALILHLSAFEGVAQRVYQRFSRLTLFVAVVSSAVAFYWACSGLSGVEMGAKTQGIIEYVWRLKFVSTAMGMGLSALFLTGRMRLQYFAVFVLLFGALYYDSAVLFRLPYGDYASRFYAVVLAVIIGAAVVRETTTNTLTHVLGLEKDAAIGRSAAQVAHDIKSPLAALSMITRSSVGLAENERLVLRTAADRISEIANELLAKRRSSESANIAADAPRAIDLSDAAEAIVMEARMRWASRPEISIATAFRDEAYGSFVRVDAQGLKRAISNVLNNAVEACEGRGEVLISLRRDSDAVFLEIRDDGKGLSPELLSRLGQIGATQGKIDGNGLGVYHATSFMESHGGRLIFESPKDGGTKVTFRFPQEPSPLWFPNSLDLYNGQNVVVLDDDESVHRVWRERFRDLLLKSGGNLIHHREHKFFFEDANVRAGALCLVDYEFVGSDTNGLNLIKRMAIRQHAVLVTSHSEDTTIREDCQKNGIMLLSKNAAGLVPLRFCSDRRPVDVVVLDDDSLVHASWRLYASMNDKSILMFFSSTELFKYANSIPSDAVCYVDYHLDEKRSGVDVCESLAKMGFINLYLATGESEDRIPACPSVRGIVGKGPHTDSQRPEDF